MDIKFSAVQAAMEQMRRLSEQQKNATAAVSLGLLSGSVGACIRNMEQLKKTTGVQNHLPFTSLGLEVVNSAVLRPAARFSESLWLGSVISSQMRDLCKPQILTGITDFAGSQLNLALKMKSIGEAFSKNRFSVTDTVALTMGSITRSYIKKSGTADPRAYEFGAEVASAVALTIDEVLAAPESTQDQRKEIFTRLVHALWQRLSSLPEGSKTRNAVWLVTTLIAIISFILSIDGHLARKKDITNRELAAILGGDTEAPIDSQSGDNDDFIPETIDDKLATLPRERVARCDAELKFSPHKNCAQLGTVRAGQWVTVIEIRHKYLLVAYLDDENGEPKCGFVLKKYFDNL